MDAVADAHDCDDDEGVGHAAVIACTLHLSPCKHHSRTDEPLPRGRGATFDDVASNPEPHSAGPGEWGVLARLSRREREQWGMGQCRFPPSPGSSAGLGAPSTSSASISLALSTAAAAYVIDLLEIWSTALVNPESIIGRRPGIIMQRRPRHTAGGCTRADI